MSKLRVHCFSVALDGYSAGPNQDLDNPVGAGGLAVFGWQFATRTHRQMSGKDGGTTGIHNDFVARGFAGVGAWIIGRNMFGPVRGPWQDDTWKGWWGDNPPYHTPVFATRCIWPFLRFCSAPENACFKALTHRVWGIKSLTTFLLRARRMWSSRSESNRH